VVRHKVYFKGHIGISVATAQHERPDIWQLIQASARASSNFTLHLTRALPCKFLGYHQLVDLICGVASQIQPLNLLSMLVEENEIRVVPRNEVELQPFVSISVAGRLDERPDFR